MIVRCTDTWPAVQFTLDNPHPGVEILSDGITGQFVSAWIISGELDRHERQHIWPGDYLLVGGGGRLFRVPEKDFATRYEIVG